MNDVPLNRLYPENEVCPDQTHLFMQFLQIRVKEDKLKEVKKLLLQSIPIYWEQQGIEDIRIMESKKVNNTFILITHWQSKTLALAGQKSSKWDAFNQKWIPLLTSGKIEIKEMFNDHYELIE